MNTSKLMKYFGMTALAMLAVVVVAQPTEASAYELTYPTQEQIRQKYSDMEFSVLKPVEYTKDYSTTSPYATGDISDEDRQQALNTVNFCRYLAGLPSDITLNDSYNETTQAASLVNASNNVLTHYPSQPSGMSDELYKLGSNGAKSSNIASGFYNITSSIIDGYVADTDSYNIDRVGHRRWVLNPSMKQTGFGFVGKFTAMYSLDRTRSENFTGDYVAWPPKNMPNELYTESDYGYAFSVSLNSSYENPSRDSVTVDLTSKLLGKSWHLDSTSTDMKTNYLAVNNDWYGMNKCIIFNVGQFPENDTVSVKINGLKKNGNSASISYTVNFFDLFDDESEYNKMSFEKDSYTINVGDSISVSPYNNPLKTRGFSWSLGGNYDSFEYSLVSDRLMVTGIAPGTMTVYAKYDGVTYTTRITAVCKHDYKLTSMVEASCTKTGSKIYTCSICQDTKTETVDKTAHRYSPEWTTDIEPTTSSEGSKSHHCIVCGAKTDITPIPKLDEPIKNTSTISASKITVGGSVKLTAKATGGSGSYKYKYFYKADGANSWTAMTSTTASASYTKKLDKTGKYYFAVKVADTKGKTSTKYFAVIVSEALKNNSTISASKITVGGSIELTAKATGGSGSYKYKYFYKVNGASSWTALTGTTASASFIKKMESSGKYHFAVKIADTYGNTSTKYFTVIVSEPLKNNSTISTSKIAVGGSVKLTAKATGGSGSYKYKYFYKAGNAKSWTALTDTTASANFTKKMESSGKYHLAVKVADTYGNTSTKYFEVTVSN